MVGRLLKLSHQLSRHYYGALPVGVWLVVLGLLVAIIGLWRRWPPAVSVLAGIIALASLALLIWGRAQRYHRFLPDRSAVAPEAPYMPLRGLEHIKVRATGRLSVEGKERFFVDLEAIYHTFETREHAVMAHVPWSRFLLARSRRQYAGMWYAFFKPEDIRRIEVGELEYGFQRRPALRLRYQGAKREEMVLLAFSSQSDLARALSDLYFDLAGPGPDLAA